jgi:serine/threonine-protein kinase HipA
MSQSKADPKEAGDVLQRLAIITNGQQVAAIDYAPLNDMWTLTYDPAWTKSPAAFPLSPVLPLVAPPAGYDSRSIRRFIENLLPEGHALDVAASTYRVAKSNAYALIAALGSETTGALQFKLTDGAALEPVAAAPREITREELNRRLAEREVLPLTVWDGKVRMSLAGVQDKLMVFLDRPLTEGGRMFLVDAPLASTHILKPDPARPQTPHLVINEHYCMSLARRMGLPVADVYIYRAPAPVLVVRRFDRRVEQRRTAPAVHRLHIIDACQAADLPAAYKYERHLGNGEHVRGIRDGMSFELLFACVARTTNKAAARLNLLQWALFQFLIGNSDAHGKNFSFFVRREGLEPAPWYDLVSVTQYDGIDHELAMAWGDDFALEDIRAFQLADFAHRCGVDRRLLRREAARLEKLMVQHAHVQAVDPAYVEEDERAFAQRLRAFVVGQASRLTRLADEASRIPAADL